MNTGVLTRKQRTFGPKWLLLADFKHLSCRSDFGVQILQKHIIWEHFGLYRERGHMGPEHLLEVEQPPHSIHHHSLMLLGIQQVVSPLYPLTHNYYLRDTILKQLCMQWKPAQQGRNPGNYPFSQPRLGTSPFGSSVAPYLSILRYYRCDTPYRAILFKGGWHSPKNGAIPPVIT